VRLHERLADGPRPLRHPNEPRGRGRPLESSATSAPESGVSSDGFSTTAFPAANRKRNLGERMANGKFHGAITPTTPTGS